MKFNNNDNIKEIQKLVKKREELEYKISDQESKFGDSLFWSTLGAGTLSFATGAVTGFFGYFIGQNKMAEHYPQIHEAQQVYANQVAADFYNEFGHIIQANPESLTRQISFYASMSSDGLASRYLRDYANEVGATLNQIAINVVGVDYGAMAINIGVAVGVTMFTSHLAGMSIVRFSRLKRISGYKKKIQKITKQIEEKTESSYRISRLEEEKTL